MGNKGWLLVLGFVFLYSCDIINYLPGFDFKLFKNTPVWDLAKAVKQEDTQRINKLLRNKSINVDFQEPKFGNTLLMLAVVNGKKESVETLLKNGANPNLVGKIGKSNSVILACEYYQNDCDTNIISLLYKFKGDINFVRKINRIEDNGMHTIVEETPLMVATSYNCIPIVKFLINNGADINKYTFYEGYGAITEALMADNLKIAKYLIIEKKAKIPSYVFIRPAGIGSPEAPEMRLSITDLLNEQEYEKGTENYQLRKEIINYLQSKGLK